MALATVVIAQTCLLHLAGGTTAAARWIEGVAGRVARHRLATLIHHLRGAHHHLIIEDDTPIARLIDASIAATLFGMGARVCWTSEVAAMTSLRAFLVRLVTATVRRAADGIRSLVRATVKLASFLWTVVVEVASLLWNVVVEMVSFSWNVVVEVASLLWKLVPLRSFGGHAAAIVFVRFATATLDAQ